MNVPLVFARLESVPQDWQVGRKVLRITDFALDFLGLFGFGFALFWVEDSP